MRWLHDLILRLRQWKYPPEFRIVGSGAHESAAAILALVKELQNALRRGAEGGGRKAEGGRGKAEGEPPQKPAGRAAGNNSRFATAVCDEHFCISNNVDQLLAKVDKCKEMRSIPRALKEMREALREDGIEYLDLTNQDYDLGREDFEMIGEAEELPGLKRPTIIRCECPAVFVYGQLVRRARGIVAKPARAKPK